MLAVDRSEARIKDVEVVGGRGQRHGYIGEPGQLTQAAQAFLVVRPFAGARIEPHFHDVDQFQVIVDGDGKIGKKAVRPVTFQYADAFTPYGPIVANDRGLSFFTLRNIASGGFWEMPGNRQNMPGRAGRNIEGIFDLAKGVPASGEVTRENLMTTQADGVAAVGLRLGAKARAVGFSADGKGQFYLICSGSVRVDSPTCKSAPSFAWSRMIRPSNWKLVTQARKFSPCSSQHPPSGPAPIPPSSPNGRRKATSICGRWGTDKFFPSSRRSPRAAPRPGWPVFQ